MTAHTFCPITGAKGLSTFGDTLNDDLGLFVAHGPILVYDSDLKSIPFFERNSMNEKSSKKQAESRPTHRGVYLLPNLFTLGALFAGFYAIIAGMQQQFESAAIALFVAMILDGLDGRVARLTHSQTRFGAEFDSLSDMLCFGLAPALVLYNWSLAYLGKPGWLAAFIYTACTALRLARFNSRQQNEDSTFFQGLSTTAAAGFIAGFVWAAVSSQLQGPTLGIGVLVVTLIVAALKVSTIRYRSFKNFDARGKVPFMVILFLVLVLALVSWDPPDVLFCIFFVYVVSGPVEALIDVLRRKR